MNLRNFWLNRKNEKNILKVVEWAHRRGVLVENLKTNDIIEAMKAYLRDPSHS
jgi:hypothetical protein